jgi:hypothetical protein
MISLGPATTSIILSTLPDNSIRSGPHRRYNSHVHCGAEEADAVDRCRRVQAGQQAPGGRQTRAMFPTVLATACVVACVVGGAHSFVAPEVAPRPDGGVSTPVAPGRPGVDRHLHHGKGAGGPLLFPDASRGPPSFERVKRPTILQFLATGKQNTADVAAATAGILTGSRPGGVFVTTVDSNRVPLDSCIKAPRLTLAQVEEVGRSSGMQSFVAAVPDCPGREANYSVIGGACTHDETALFAELYDTGVAFMIIGASRDEAFASFLHARQLAWTLRCCEPRLNPEGTVALPHSYSVLYDVVNAKLSARLRESQRLRPSSRENIRTALRHQAVEGKRSAALSVGLDKTFDSATLLPSDDDFRAGGVAVRAHLSSADALTWSEEVETAEGESMEEWRCDESVYSADTYKLRKLPGYVLQSRYEVCCAKECFYAEYASKSATGLENCCVGCNRFKCDPLGSGGLAELAEMSKIMVPPKEDCAPEIVSVAV